uniref:Uncharacterized protein n=1 Tax=Oryza brachyantha TaxID=4533 RepID=J3NB20_ORYBR
MAVSASFLAAFFALDAPAAVDGQNADMGASASSVVATAACALEELTMTNDVPTVTMEYESASAIALASADRPISYMQLPSASMVPVVAPSSRLLLSQLCSATTQRKLLPTADDLLHRANPPLLQQRQHHSDLWCHCRLLTARADYDYNNPAKEEEEESSPKVTGGFETAVSSGDFHTCHDVVEELCVLWCTAEPRGAIMELGEGLCKLRKLRLDNNDDSTMIHFYRFQEEVAVALNFICCTHMELMACIGDLCLTMDGSASSYQLLGNFAKGQQLYRLQLQADGDDVPSIVFSAASNSRV